MIVKFNRQISDYQYILSFDIAKRVTGYSLFDFQRNEVVNLGKIDLSNFNGECYWQEFYQRVINSVDEILNKYSISSEDILVTKEKLPNQNGRFSTIETLQGLAQAHAVFDLAITHKGIDVYDYDGIHSVSVKSYFKTLTEIEKPQKEDIANYLIKKFNIDKSDLIYDMTDSLAVTLTLIGKKYNADILEKIKEIKKEMRNAKTSKKISSCQEKIDSLNSMLLS